MNRSPYLLLLLLQFCLLLAGCSFKDQVPPPTAPIDSSGYTVSGRITSSNTSVANIRICLGDNLYCTYTQADGSYAITGVAPGSYRLAPQKEELRFIPEHRLVSIVDSSVSDLNFTAYLPLVKMISIPGGTFSLGDVNALPEERPVRQVTLDTFELGTLEITQDQWETVMGTNPSRSKVAGHPVESVTWFDAVTFCNYLSDREGLARAYTYTGQTASGIVTCDFAADGYRLPTEAEWEYACRAGTTTDRYSGNGFSIDDTCGSEPTLEMIGWYCYNSGNQHKSCGLKQPNSLGLYDMIGNVAEWCWNWYENYTAEPVANPSGPVDGTLRTYRGGSAFETSLTNRAACRSSTHPMVSYSGLGFRIARSTTQ